MTETAIEEGWIVTAVADEFPDLRLRWIEVDGGRRPAQPRRRCATGCGTTVRPLQRRAGDRDARPPGPARLPRLLPPHRPRPRRDAHAGRGGRDGPPHGGRLHLARPALGRAAARPRRDRRAGLGGRRTTSLDGPLGIRQARGGERLGAGQYANDLLPGTARGRGCRDAGRRAVRRHRRAEYLPTPATKRVRVFTVQVEGVPELHVEEALWSCAEALDERLNRALCSSAGGFDRMVALYDDTGRLTLGRRPLDRAGRARCTSRRSARQIARLERELSDDARHGLPAHRRSTVVGAPARGPRLLTLGELEVLRDDLAAKLATARAAVVRRADEEAERAAARAHVASRPGDHKFVRVANARPRRRRAAASGRSARAWASSACSPAGGTSSSPPAVRYPARRGPQRRSVGSRADGQAQPQTSGSGRGARCRAPAPVRRASRPPATPARRPPRARRRGAARAVVAVPADRALHPRRADPDRRRLRQPAATARGTLLVFGFALVSLQRARAVGPRALRRLPLALDAAVRASAPWPSSVPLFLLTGAAAARDPGRRRRRLRAARSASCARPSRGGPAD